MKKVNLLDQCTTIENAFSKAELLILKVAPILFVLFLFVTNLFAQSGGWDATSANGITGSFDYGNGVYRLLSDVNTGCAGSSISETSVTYDPNGVTDFNQCYQVFFGCPGNDNIGAGTDLNGDGIAFSFSKGPFSLVANSCGGGLGYMEARADNKIITIEFDTYSSMGTAGFDANYGGGTTGFNDEISLHKDGQAGDALGLIEPLVGAGGIVNAGNLEDGLEHAVCINYNHITHVLSVTIDGVTKLAYDLDLKGMDLATYFGAGGLSQTWSSGKFGATNPSTVSNGANITANLGGVPLCPAGIDITSPANGAIFNGCPVGPITITATATPPAGNSVTFVEFFVDGISIGTDNTANYSIVYTSPTAGNHALTAVAHWSGGSTSSTLFATNITVGGNINLTSTPPTIDATIEALWTSYASTIVSKGNGAMTPDLAATYKVMYDATNLYVLVDVTDDILIRDGSGGLWEDDGIELFIDMGNDKAGAYGANDYQFSFNWNNGTVVENKHGVVTGATFAQTNRAGGYIMEIRLPWSLLGTVPTSGASIGFDIGVNDDDNNGTRDNQLSWNDATFGEWNNPSLFGTLQFSNCNPLPISLISFTGKLTNNKVVLNWSTAVEINNNKFIIERSSDLSSWNSIGVVAAGVGNSISIKNYSLIDYYPLEGVGYYRLRQVDNDGTIAYSSIVAVELINKLVSISIMPNPFDDALTLQSTSQDALEIIIYDVLGRLLFHANQKVIDGLVVIHPELSSGTYVVTVQAGALIERQMVVKK